MPSLWHQEIIDALLIQEYPDFKTWFEKIADGKVPAKRFEESDRIQQSLSLSTAGFPNVITALVPSQAAAEKLGQQLEQTLTDTWKKLGEAIRHDIRGKVSLYCQSVLAEDNSFEKEYRIAVPNWSELWAEFSHTLPQGSDSTPYEADLKRWQPNYHNTQNKPLYPNWKWRNLWDCQLDYSWEPYWIAIPLGAPICNEKALPLSIDKKDPSFDTWQQAQNTVSNSSGTLPTAAETELYETFNVGSWWGSFQQRLKDSLQSVKNTRVWQIPAAPGDRSTLSGQFSVVHPSFDYGLRTDKLTHCDLREGAGLPESSLRFFWFLMSKAYPGVFNGSERLNALELTKRLAWDVGGIATALGIQSTQTSIHLPTDRLQALDIKEIPAYDHLIRFPNLSSIASARFVHDDLSDRDPSHVKKTPEYWKQLAHKIKTEFKSEGGKEKRRQFASRTCGRPFHVAKTDQAVNPNNNAGADYNGVMFSSKWLAEDMGLETPAEKERLRAAVKATHAKLGFGDRSPSDWWVIVLADGDNMGQYISGDRLKPYEDYLNLSVIDETTQSLLNQCQPDGNSLMKTRKRMGPASHVGLNRALLDFSNRLVPYLTEKRFCGKLVYSGGDDVMAVLPIEDLPGYLLSLQSAWCGATDDPWQDHDELVTFKGKGGYWQTEKDDKNLLPNRPLFTMGNGATMSMGIVIAHKTVPLPTVLESLWAAEKDRAKKLPGKNGLCFRVIYSGGNQLEATMCGDLLADWWQSIKNFDQYKKDLAPALYRLAAELPQRALLTSGSANLFASAAEVIMNRRDNHKDLAQNFEAIKRWLICWEAWAVKVLRAQFGDNPTHQGKEPWEDTYLAILRGDPTEKTLPLGTHPDDLGKLLRFTAFWVDRRVERWQWLNKEANS